MTRYQHTAVMSREVVELLEPVPAGWLIDATVGGGGHARALLEARPDVRVLGVDRDPTAVAAASAALAEFGDRARVVHGNFSQLAAIASEASEGMIMGILFDLGVSSPQLDWPERGFSYWGDAPLDMRMDAVQELTAAQVLNEYAEEDLVSVLVRYGDEKFARRIAAQIVARRPLETTADLVAAVKHAIPARARRRGPHPARRTFQAIRMEVNRELPNLAAGLDESVHLLAPGGRILVLSYHSIEDRLVKERFTKWTDVSEQPPGLPVEPVRNPLVRVLTRRPVRPRPAEIAANRRAESARLRAAERVRATARP